MARSTKQALVQYNHEPEATHALRFPFSVGGLRIETISLSPPTLADLRFFRFRENLDAADILAACSSIDVETIRLMRWPDVDAALAIAFEMIPADLVTLLKGEADAKVDAVEAPIALSQDEGDPGSFTEFI